MPTTTKMGIVYPASTDLVKDGATAMGTISTTVDAKTGMVLLNTTSFSAVSTVSLAANTFTSNYNNYRIIFSKMSASNNVDCYMRLRAAGSDNTTSNYNSSYSGVRANNTTFTNAAASAATFLIGSVKSVEFGGFSLDVYSPQSTQFTGFINHWNGCETSWYNFGTSGGVFAATTSFDSLTVYPNGGTITGTYSVFGYNQ